MDKEILSWLNFTKEKVRELELLESLFRNGIVDSNKEAYEFNKTINDGRKQSQKIYDTKVRERIANLVIAERKESFQARIKIQRKELGYLDLVTTTIRSFPQTP
ncbi:hypothetical protein [Helicobacter monodelphidis]